MTSIDLDSETRDLRLAVEKERLEAELLRLKSEKKRLSSQNNERWTLVRDAVLPMVLSAAATLIVIVIAVSLITG